MLQLCSSFFEWPLLVYRYRGKKCFFFLVTFSVLHAQDTHSQLDLSLFKLLQRLLSLTRRESGGELGGLDSTKELHQEVKSEEGNKPLKENSSQLKIRTRHGSKGCSILQPVRGLSGVCETEDGAELHPQYEVEDKEGLFA